MEENNTTLEFDNRIESILNDAAKKENARKNHWWNDLCPCDLVCIVCLIGCLILAIIGVFGLIFNW